MKSLSISLLGFFTIIFAHHAVWAKKPPLIAPFPSTVASVTIPNTHVFKKEKGEALRGMAPLTATEAEQLHKYGITDVMIFRNDVPGETGISDEINLFKPYEKQIKITHVGFKWKEITEFKEPCLQSLEGLKTIHKILNDSQRKLFFHCTVGEDRTGYLAGLYRMIYDGKTSDEVFKTEMCAHGYAEADPTKPEKISAIVHENVTLLFAKMSYLIEKKKVDFKKLDPSLCDKDPALEKDFPAYWENEQKPKRHCQRLSI